MLLDSRTSQWPSLKCILLFFYAIVILIKSKSKFHISRLRSDFSFQDDETRVGGAAVGIWRKETMFLVD